MTPLPFTPRLSTFAVIAAAAALGACSSLSLGEQRNEEIETLRGDERSDYDILTCSDMAVIETNARQRLARLRPNTENRVEREFLLRAQINEISLNQREKGCAPSRSAALAAASEAEPVALEPAIKALDSTPVPASAAASTPGVAGRFLQIGAFADAGNAERAADHFATQGFRTEIRVGDGSGTHRVLVGPLNGRGDAARASNAAREYGVNDAFFIDG